MRKLFVAAAMLLVGAALQAQVKVGPYLQAVNETGFTVVWETEDDVVAWVEVAPDDGTHFYNTERAMYYQSELGKKVVGKHHVVAVDALEPATTYRYTMTNSQGEISHRN